jgi:hypothetical protein
MEFNLLSFVYPAGFYFILLGVQNTPMVVGILNA